MKNLIKHSDFEAFQRNIFKNSTFNAERNLFGEGNEFHVRIPVWGMYWDEKAMRNLKARVDILNQETKELKFEVTNLIDWEIEEGERTWDARIYFKVVGL